MYSQQGNRLVLQDLTISSLQMGQASLGPAPVAAALPSSLWSKETLELRSWASEDGCDVDAVELTDMVLAEGESKLEVLRG